jgi:hypothetical protein
MTGTMSSAENAFACDSVLVAQSVQDIREVKQG